MPSITLNGDVTDLAADGTTATSPQTGAIVYGNIDFQHATGDDKAIAGPLYSTLLGVDGTPIYAGGAGTATTFAGFEPVVVNGVTQYVAPGASGNAVVVSTQAQADADVASGLAGTAADWFNTWYHSAPSFNSQASYAVTLDATPQNGISEYSYSNTSFFPFNDFTQPSASQSSLGNQGQTGDGTSKDFGFTYHVSSIFQYLAGQAFSYTSEDDLLVYINGRLALNLGGVHGPESASIDFGQTVASGPYAGQTVAQALGLTPGQNYSIDIFSANRSTPGSQFTLQTNSPSPPSISGTMAGQTTIGDAAISPFTQVSVTDPGNGTDTLTIQLTTGGMPSGAGGMLSESSGPALTSNGGAVYTLAPGSAANVQAELRALIFTPAPGAPGTMTTTGFELFDTSSASPFPAAFDNTTTVTDTRPSPPTISNTSAPQASSEAAVHPFLGVSVSDPNSGATDTLTVTASSMGGAYAGQAVQGATTTPTAGGFTITGSADAITATLRGVVYAPAPSGVPNGSVTTVFTLSDVSAVQNGAGGTTTYASNTDTSSRVVETDPSVAPTIAVAAGTASTTTANEAAVNPFRGVTVSDANSASGQDTGGTAPDVLTIVQSGPGVLTGAQATATPGTYTLSGTAQQITNALTTVSFTPAAGQPNSTVSTTFSLSDASQASSATATASVTVNDTTSATASVVANASQPQASANGAAVSPFAGATVTDPNAHAMDTLTITPSTAGGTFAPGAMLPAGVTAGAGANGTYVISGSAPGVTQALDALTYAPAKAGVANGSVTTSFTLSDTNSTNSPAATDTHSRVTETDAAAAPAFSGAGPVATAFEAAVKPFAGVTLTDANSASDGDMASTATDTVTITQSGGGALTGAGLTQTGANTYSLTAGTAAQVTTALHGLTFTPAGAGSTTFTLNNASSAGTAAAPATVTDYTASSGGTTVLQPTNLDVQLGFSIQLDNLIRAVATDPGLSNPTSPLYAALQAEKGIALQLDSGQLAIPDAENALYHLVDGTTSVAEITYAFFTGRTPSAAGLDYLVNSPANPNDVNDAYYAKFTTENRYINFANNLATGSGAGAAAFQAAYGSLSLGDAVTEAYAQIFGTTPTADKVSAILNAQVSNGLGGTETRAQYFADITGGSATSQKAAAIGFLLADSVKEGFGAYQQADLHFLADLAHGTAIFNVDLLAAYTVAPALVGQSTTDTSLHG